MILLICREHRISVDVGSEHIPRKFAKWDRLRENISSLV